MFKSGNRTLSLQLDSGETGRVVASVSAPPERSGMPSERQNVNPSVSETTGFCEVVPVSWQTRRAAVPLSWNLWACVLQRVGRGKRGAPPHGLRYGHSQHTAPASTRSNPRRTCRDIPGRVPALRVATFVEECQRCVPRDEPRGLR